MSFDQTPAVLVLEDGSVFRGISIGALGASVGEVVFNTAMTGYQEVLSDPSYARQIVTLTYPHIGNVGVNPDDNESARVWASGLVVRDCTSMPSNWRCTQSFSEYLIEHGVVGIAGVDTRRLTRLIREQGALKGCMMAGDVDESRALSLCREFSGLNGLDLVDLVSTKSPYIWSEPSHSLSREFERKGDRSYHVVVCDFGVKRNILRLLVDHGCRVTVVPAQTTFEDLMGLKPDGVVLSNGPGDPAASTGAIALTRALLRADVPIFGICLGIQLLALAEGGKTVKMKFGHHGVNHPILDLRSGAVMMTSQNHGFAVDRDSLPSEFVVTHISLFDQTVQGIKHTARPAFGFQGHPEGGPGPQDVISLFREFVELM